jgi:hypothetical protein
MSLRTRAAAATAAAGLGTRFLSGFASHITVLLKYILHINIKILGI